MIQLESSATRSYRFEVRQFRRMLAAGVFADQKVELVGGRIFELTDLPPHTFAIGEIHEALRALLPPEHWTIREEKPLLIGRHWAPKPDIAVLRGPDTSYATRLPRPGDVALLIEVADTTYSRDRGRKWRRYAASGIPMDIIVRLRAADTTAEVWTGPVGRGRAARYVDVVEYAARAGESVPIVLDGQEFGRVPLADLIAPPRRP
jgi:hypothetical protein